MSQADSGNEILSSFIGKEVVISFRKLIYSASSTMSKGIPYIKGKILRVKPKFILIQYKDKPMALNVDNILSIE